MLFIKCLVCYTVIMALLAVTCMWAKGYTFKEIDWKKAVKPLAAIILASSIFTTFLLTLAPTRYDTSKFNHGVCPVCDHDVTRVEETVYECPNCRRMYIFIKGDN